MFKQILSRSSSRLFRPIFERRCKSVWQETAIEIRYWDGRRFQTGRGPAVATMEIGDPAVLMALVANPSLGFGNSYTQGRLRIEGDLQAVLGEPFSRCYWNRSSFNCNQGSRCWMLAAAGEGCCFMRSSTTGFVVLG